MNGRAMRIKKPRELFREAEDSRPMMGIYIAILFFLAIVLATIMRTFQNDPTIFGDALVFLILDIIILVIALPEFLMDKYKINDIVVANFFGKKPLIPFIIGGGTGIFFLLVFQFSIPLSSATGIIGGFLGFLWGVIAPVPIEEGVYRGIMQPWLNQWLSGPMGIIGSLISIILQASGFVAIHILVLGTVTSALLFLFIFAFLITLGNYAMQYIKKEWGGIGFSSGWHFTMNLLNFIH